MDTRYTLEPEHLDELIADPAPFSDYLDEATDHTVFRGQVRDAIDYALRTYGLTSGNRHRPTADNDAWRQADRAELAEKIAIHLCAGLAPVMEESNMRAFLGALELAKKNRAAREAPRA